MCVRAISSRIALEKPCLWMPSCHDVLVCKVCKAPLKYEAVLETHFLRLTLKGSVQVQSSPLNNRRTGVLFFFTSTSATVRMPSRSDKNVRIFKQLWHLPPLCNWRQTPHSHPGASWICVRDMEGKRGKKVKDWREITERTKSSLT